MERTNYLKKKVDLLLRVIPYLNEFEELVLIGGTAINFFLTHDYKRYSVDIDLVFNRPNIQSMSSSDIQHTVDSYLKQIGAKLLKQRIATKIIFNKITPLLK